MIRKFNVITVIISPSIYQMLTSWKVQSQVSFLAHVTLPIHVFVVVTDEEVVATNGLSDFLTPRMTKCYRRTLSIK